MDLLANGVRKVCWGLLVAFTTASAFGQYEVPNAAYNAPASYYTAATGTGATLKANLNNIISVMTKISYDEARYIFKDIDKDPNNPNNIILFYTDTSVNGTWDGGVTFNREHVWPKSLIGIGAPGGSTRNATTDLFELKPADPAVNTNRSNEPYGLAGTTGGYSDHSSYWFPGTLDKGDAARVLFYMATRYQGENSEPTLTLVNGTSPAIGQMGDLDALLHWHYQDGISNFERARNQTIYSNPNGLEQANRNPYVDHPEYVWSVFGGGNNNSRLYVGGVNPADGTSNVDLSLGRVIKNGTFSTTSTTLTKTGANPTTYDITLSGAATSTQAGVGQGFDYNGQTRSLTFGLTGGTATTGLKSGTITVNNTDLTTGGAGLGSADGNDTINLSATVVDKRLVTPTSVAFGRVIAGSSVTGTSTLSTTMDDNNATRVNVAPTAAADANGISVTGVSALFDAATDTATRTVGGAFASIGAKSGTLNLAVSSAENGGTGLTGEGAYAAVGIPYTATSLNHSNASFTTPADNNTATLNFGVKEVGTGTYSQNNLIYNLISSPAFTAALDLDTIAFAGDTNRFSSTISAFSNLAAGSFRSSTFSFNSSIEGTFSETVTLGTSDENVPGSYASGSQVLTLTVIGRSLSRQWLASVSGNWSDTTNWVGAVPNGVGAAANFLTEPTAAVSVNLDTNRTVGSITFNNVHGYTISGANTLTLDGTTSSLVSVLAGSHTISSPVYLADSSTTISTNAGTSLGLSGGLSGIAGAGLTKSGAGSLALANAVVPGAVMISGGTVTTSGTFSAASLNNAGTFSVGGTAQAGPIDGGGSTVATPGSALSATHIRQSGLTLNGTAATFSQVTLTTSSPGYVGDTAQYSDVTALTIANDNATIDPPPQGGYTSSERTYYGALDVTNNDMIVRNANYDVVQDMVRAGFNNGTWSGMGLTSTVAADMISPLFGYAAVGAVHNDLVDDDNDPNTAMVPVFSSFDGQTLVGDETLVKFTFYGDANLDGVVDFADYGFIDAGIAGAGTGWLYGDFDYDGIVSATDYGFIDAGVVGSNTFGAVPEPSTFLLAGLAMALLAGSRAIQGRRPAARAVVNS